MVIEADMGSDYLKVGIFRSPEQWCREAAVKVFPTDTFEAVPLDVKQAVSFIVSSSPLEVMKYRIAQVARVRAIVAECRSEQLQESARMRPEVALIMAPMQT
eukprot:5663593-Amphidinium_carterae.1